MKFTPSRAHATAVLPRPVNGSIAVASLDRLVGNEPGVAAAAHAPGRAAPASDVGLVLIRDAKGKTVERSRPLRREVKDEFVAVIQKPVAVDWLVVTDGEVAGQARGRARRRPVDRNRLDPVNDVL